jgi:hypothetical protein
VRALGEQEVVALVEEVARLKPLDRAVRLFARATGDSIGVAADAPVSERDLTLFELYVAMFGDIARFLQPCSECGETLEGELALSQVIDAAQSAPCKEGLRSPTSREIAELAQGGDVEAVLNACLGRKYDSVEEAQSQIERAFPHINVELPLICEACGAHQSVRFDIAEFLWPELERIAARWFDDVHRLARAYGWGENEIASMPPQRRAQYLKRISA